MGKKKSVKAAPVADKIESNVRDYRGVISIGGANSDWGIGEGTLSTDSAVWQNIFLLRSRMRDLFRTNPYFQVYRRMLWSNVFGDKGIMLTMEIKETEDRVVHSQDEKWALIQHERKINEIRRWAAEFAEKPFHRYCAYHLADRLERASEEDILTRKAMVKVGAPDLFANLMIESAWKEWQRKEYSDVRQRVNYAASRRLRLISACRDGDIFYHRIKDPRVNKFGYSLRMVNSEWCDYWYNVPRLANGNEVRMGIEYQRDDFGITKPVAYHFIKRQPGDWQFTIPGAFNFGQGTFHDRVPAEDIIHYGPLDDNDSTRPAPWGVSAIPKVRQLDKTEEAHVIASRAAACKMGWFTSNLVPEGGLQVPPPDPRGLQARKLEPGSIEGLPYGIEVQTFDPNFPNANLPEFRKAMLRSFCASNPGASYAVIGNDYESINFSAGRLDRLATTGDWKLMQQDDIDMAERPIFEDFLEMALIVGAIPLPFTQDKFKKFNRPHFQARRWEGVDEIKEVTAAALRIANGFSSHTAECAELGKDFEKICFQRAEDKMLLEELDLSTTLTVESVKQPQAAEDTADDGANAPEEADSDTDKKPTKKVNGKKTLLNGRH